MNTRSGRWVRLWLAALAMGAALAGCSQKDLLDKVTSPEDRALGAKVIADLQGGPSDDADLMSRIQPELRAKIAGVLPQMRAVTPKGPYSESHLAGANFTELVQNGQKIRVSNLAYEVGGDGKFVLVRLQIVRRDGGAQIGSLYVNRLAGPIEQLTAFRLEGKSPGQLAFLALTVLVPLFIIVSEVILVRTRRIPLKWLWFIGCLLGVCQVSMDWGSGQVVVSPLYVQLLGAFAIRSGLGPWRIGFAIPVVSIVFLALRKKIQKPGPKPPQTEFT